MVRICVAGACGRMGRRILELAAQAEDLAIGGAFDLPAAAGTDLPLAAGTPRAATVTLQQTAEDALRDSDAIIDFTAPDACVAHVQTAAELGKAVVVGTTGLSPEQNAVIHAAAQRVPVVYAPNMSVGVNLLFKLVSEAARILGPDYDIEVVEIHHNQKKDSPSGTAVRLVERAAESRGLRVPDQTRHGREGLVGARPQDEIGVHAVRGGDVTGDHTVYFLGQGERVELTHRAHSRDTFAQGALRAARFTASAAPGLYDMQDVLGLR